MKANYLELVEESKALNARVFSLMRMQILDNLDKVKPEAATFQELKNALQTNDGALYANLKALQEMAYLKNTVVKIEQKNLEAWQITQEGSHEWCQTKQWLKKFLEE